MYLPIKTDIFWVLSFIKILCFTKTEKVNRFWNQLYQVIKCNTTSAPAHRTESQKTSSFPADLASVRWAALVSTYDIHVVNTVLHGISSRIDNASIIVEQIPGTIFQGGGLRSTTFIIYIKIFVLVHSFQIKRLPPWQTWYNSSIQDGVQDGCQL